MAARFPSHVTVDRSQNSPNKIHDKITDGDNFFLWGMGVRGKKVGEDSGGLGFPTSLFDGHLIFLGNPLYFFSSFALRNCHAGFLFTCLIRANVLAFPLFDTTPQRRSVKKHPTHSTTMRRLTDKQLMRVAKRNIMLIEAVARAQGRRCVVVHNVPDVLPWGQDDIRWPPACSAWIPAWAHLPAVARLCSRNAPSEGQGPPADAAPRSRSRRVRRVAPFASFVRSKFHDASFAKLPAFQRIKALAEMWRSIRRSAASA